MQNNASQFAAQGFPWPLPDAKREMREAATTREGFAWYRAGPITPPAAPVEIGFDLDEAPRRSANEDIADFDAHRKAVARVERTFGVHNDGVKRGKYADPKLGHGLGHARNFKDDPNPAVAPLANPARRRSTTTPGWLAFTPNATRSTSKSPTWRPSGDWLDPRARRFRRAFAVATGHLHSHPRGFCRVSPSERLIMSVWELLAGAITLAQLVSRYPHLRRFQQQGFELDPKNHDNDVVGLRSRQQRLRVNLVTGDVLCSA